MNFLATFLLFLASAFCVQPSAASAAERFAILFAGENYESIQSLRNPINDVFLVSEALEEAAFSVERVLDPTRNEMERELGSFTSLLSEYSTHSRIEAVLFYFAGHAVQHRAENYLLPVDIDPSMIPDDDMEAEIDVGRRLEQLDQVLQNEAVSVSEIISQINGIDADIFIFIFDSCRNPFFDGVLESDGLAEIVAGPNNYIVFATTPGAVALDGTGSNSPFSSALASRIRYQGVPIEVAIRGVRRDVYHDTDGFQLPWGASSLMYSFSFIPLGPFGEREPITTSLDEDRQLWQTIVDTGYPAGSLRRYLLLFPDGIFANEAQTRLTEEN